MSGQPSRLPERPENGVVANAWLVARREFSQQVHSRLFGVSTGLLGVLAVRQARDWQFGDGAAPLRVNVNLSPFQLRHPGMHRRQEARPYFRMPLPYPRP